MEYLELESEHLLFRNIVPASPKALKKFYAILIGESSVPNKTLVSTIDMPLF